MTDATTTTPDTQPATNEGKKGPRVVKHIDVRIEELREDIAERQAKLDALLASKSNQENVSKIERGTAISFEYGRGDKKRTESGIVLAVVPNEKTGAIQFNVLVGTGLESKTLIVSDANLIFDAPAAE